MHAIQHANTNHRCTSGACEMHTQALNLRIEDLLYEIKCLKQDLAQSVDESAEALLAGTLGLKSGQVTRTIVGLYNTGGRVVTVAMLDELWGQSKTGADREYVGRQARVVVSRIRKVLGDGAVQTVWRHGYRMTPEGLAAVAGAMQGIRPVKVDQREDYKFRRDPDTPIEPWTQAEDAILVQGHAEGMSYGQLVGRLRGRTRCACISRMKRIRKPERFRKAGW